MKKSDKLPGVDITEGQSRPNGSKEVKTNGFKPKPSEAFVTTDAGKLEAVKHVARPPDFKSQVEVSNFTEYEVELNAIMMVQREFILNPKIDCVVQHIYWKSVFRRSVDGQLSEQLIQLNRASSDPMKGLGGLGASDFAPSGRSY